MRPRVALVTRRETSGRRLQRRHGERDAMEKRRKWPGTRYRPGQIRFPRELFVMLHLLLGRAGGLLKRLVVTPRRRGGRRSFPRKRESAV